MIEDNEIMVDKDSEVYKAAEALIEAAHAFWVAKDRAGSSSAVQWLFDTEGAFFLYSRGEYAKKIQEAVKEVIREGWGW